MRTVYLYGLTVRKPVPCAEQRFRLTVLYGEMVPQVHICSGTDGNTKNILLEITITDHWFHKICARVCAAVKQETRPVMSTQFLAFTYICDSNIQINNCYVFLL